MRMPKTSAHSEQTGAARYRHCQWSTVHYNETAT